MLISQLQAYLSARLLGEDREIKKINAIDLATDEDVSFIIWPQDIKFAKTTNASCIICSLEVAAHWADEFPCSILVVDNACDSFLKISSLNLFNEVDFLPNIHKTTVIAPNVIIEKNVYIGANSVVNSGSIIRSNTIIGDNVIIGFNTIIGSTAFAPFGDEKLVNLPSLGSVKIENNCFIGDFVSIAKGILSSTSLAENCYIDNMTHIGHDSILEKNVIIAAQCGIAGFVRIKEYATLAGQVGVAPFVCIGAHSKITAASKLFCDVDKEKIYSGYPAMEHNGYLRMQASLKKKFKKR